MTKPFIKTQKDINKLQKGDRIFSEYYRRTLEVLEIEKDRIYWTVRDWYKNENKAFTVWFSCGEILANNYRYPNRLCK